jgi:peptide/nickel transport system substrate-binding protein
VASRVNQLIFAPLFIMGQDAVPQPFLVKNFEQLSDTSFKIIIKDNLYFHDGSNLTAQDVAYTFLELSSKDVLSPHQEKFLYLKDIKIIDDKTLIFELNKAHAAFLTELCALGIVSKKSCFNRSKECRNEYNGSGPFMVEKWDTNKETLYLKPFLKWFEGTAKNNLTVRVVRDENTRILELIGQKTDIVEGDISAGRIAELKKQDFLDVKGNSKLWIYLFGF